ncbi:1-(5-phosphoribosyl)-5-[(5-phosphoribosylamino)methylideneamino]imidazole-4-carboxamide isomerase [Buchnera aphidicola]|uniref:1-(5-phosphoribosyl)-5-[(5- phosphoribosylamino)methylideneamino]imidazole-4- carboxamide isomerase n=1 Tax=Buchnera aphidicola TaxID=9 RepID=UPI003463A8B4
MIIPAFDIINHQVVRLYQGNYCKKTCYDIDLYNYLNEYHKKGVKIIHLVDLDGAQNSSKRQLQFFKDIISYKIISLQIGGGIRTEEDINTLLMLGAKRVVIGSVAIEKKNIVKKWLNTYGADSIVLALDVHVNKDNHKKIAINGWQKTTDISLEEILNFFSDTGLKHVLCTDISRDGTLSGPNIKLYQEICQNFNNIHFQASGGISTYHDISLLKNIGVKSIIIGRSLLEGQITIQEALKCWQNG